MVLAIVASEITSITFIYQVTGNPAARIRVLTNLSSALLCLYHSVARGHCDSNANSRDRLATEHLTHLTDLKIPTLASGHEPRRGELIKIKADAVMRAPTHHIFCYTYSVAWGSRNNRDRLATGHLTHLTNTNQGGGGSIDPKASWCELLICRVGNPVFKKFSFWLTFICINLIFKTYFFML